MFLSVFFFLATVVHLANAGRTIALDGSLEEWHLIERMHPKPWETPTYLPDFAVYGTYSSDPSTYYFAVKTDGITTIGNDTTIWLDIDQDKSTGTPSFPVGQEFYINIYPYDGKPYLYNSNYQYIAPLDHAFNADRSIMEVAVSASNITDVDTDIDIIMDINNELFLPEFYTLPPFTVKTRDLPPRTSDVSNKRVALVFSQATADKFFLDYAYSQLYASMQHQVMMAGIPFDLIAEEALKILGNLVNYDALIFPYNANNVNAEDASLISGNLKDLVYHYKIGIITSGDWFTNDEAGDILTTPYQTMHELLGVTITGTAPPQAFNIIAVNTSHPVLSGYQPSEQLLHYTSKSYNIYGPTSDTTADITVLAVAADDGGSVQEQNATMLASVTPGGARHVHFGDFGFMGDTNLVWQAVRWAVFGNSCPIGLQLSRQKSVFISRCDMDQSPFPDDFDRVTKALYDDFVLSWKESYNFVGTYFINIGTDENNNNTDWKQSAPLFNMYIEKGNEIGSHSYTHPNYISALTDDQLKFQFDDAQQVIQSELALSRIGTSQPGNPENFQVVSFLEQYLLYFSGTWTGVGAGFPSAFGFLKPDFDMFYVAPNMKSDFSLIQFEGLTAQEATDEWANAYQAILSHASTPIVHWHWHDYGPTINPGGNYTVKMFQDTIEMAYNDDTEFVTVLELYDRIQSMAASELIVDDSGGTLSTRVVSTDAGCFALDVGCVGSQVIEKVDDWYAYNDKKVFLPMDGGDFVITLGQSANSSITRITELPMRAKLLALKGNGTELEFTFTGQGCVIVELNSDMAQQLEASSTGSTSSMVDNFMEQAGTTTLKLNFTEKGTYTVNILLKGPTTSTTSTSTSASTTPTTSTSTTSTSTSASTTPTTSTSTTSTSTSTTTTSTSTSTTTTSTTAKISKTTKSTKAPKISKRRMDELAAAPFD